MDIVQVLGVQLSGQIEEAKLDINSVLANPMQDKALDKLSSSIKKFALLKMQLDTIASLSQQMTAESQPQPENNEN